jgi:hypothetical protein
MKQAISGALVAICLAASISPSLAETSRPFVTANDAMTLWDEGDPTIIAYLNVILNGFEWANTPQRIFCLPSKLPLTQQQNVTIMAEHLRQHPEHDGMPVAFVMLVGLKEIFPCQSKQSD